MSERMFTNRGMLIASKAKLLGTGYPELPATATLKLRPGSGVRNLLGTAEANGPSAVRTMAVFMSGIRTEMIHTRRVDKAMLRKAI